MRERGKSELVNVPSSLFTRFRIAHNGEPRLYINGLLFNVHSVEPAFCTGRQLLVDSPPHSIAHRHLSLSLSLNPLTPRLPFTAQGIATLLDAEKEAAQIVAKARDCMCNYPPLSSLSNCLLLYICRPYF